MAQPELRLPMFFSEPRRRSWPYEPTRLEIMATRLGIDDEDLRELLRGEIERRRVVSAGDNTEAPPRHHQHSI